jgi:hypothetical protein
LSSFAATQLRNGLRNGPGRDRLVVNTCIGWRILSFFTANAAANARADQHAGARTPPPSPPPRMPHARADADAARAPCLQRAGAYAQSSKSSNENAHGRAGRAVSRLFSARAAQSVDADEVHSRGEAKVSLAGEAKTASTEGENLCTGGINCEGKTHDACGRDDQDADRDSVSTWKRVVTAVLWRKKQASVTASPATVPEAALSCAQCETFNGMPCGHSSCCWHSLYKRGWCQIAVMQTQLRAVTKLLRVEGIDDPPPYACSLRNACNYLVAQARTGASLHEVRTP